MTHINQVANLYPSFWIKGTRIRIEIPVPDSVLKQA